VVSAANRTGCGHIASPAVRFTSFTSTLRALAGIAAATLLWLSPALAAERTLERGNGPEPDSLDPQRAQGLSAHQVLRDLYEGLVRTEADGALVAAAAEAIAVSPDGREYRFTLRADLRWSDGAPVAAGDFGWRARRSKPPSRPRIRARCASNWPPRRPISCTG
jgi:ABC-type oligopeptide transport system substrate-binding subunit